MEGIDDEASIKMMMGSRAIPGNSVRDVGERIKGGAVSEERSPENEAILISGKERGGGGRRNDTHDLRKEDQLPRWATGTAWEGVNEGEQAAAAMDGPLLEFRTWWLRKEGERGVGREKLKEAGWRALLLHDVTVTWQ